MTDAERDEQVSLMPPYIKAVYDEYMGVEVRTLGDYEKAYRLAMALVWLTGDPGEDFACDAAYFKEQMERLRAQKDEHASNNTSSA